MTSTLLAGCSAPTVLVSTTTTIMRISTTVIAVSQRFSVRATTSCGTMPSASGRSIGLVGCSANGTPPQEEQKVKEDPTQEQETDGNDREGQSADRSSSERHGSGVCSDRRGDMRYLVGRGH